MKSKIRLKSRLLTRNNQSFNQQAITGITLIELVIVVSLTITIAFFAIASYSKIIQISRYKISYQMLLTDLLYAKDYTNKRNIRVSICNSHDGKQCNQETPYDWSQGWLLFKDPHGQFQPSSDDLLRSTRLMNPPNALSIRSDNNLQNGLNFNRFRRYGKSQGSGLPNGTIRFCAPNQREAKIIINLFGDSRLAAGDLCPA